MVLMDAINDRRQHEVTVRRVTVDAKGGLRLTFVTQSADLGDPGVELPHPFQGQFLDLQPGVRGQIRGRVSMMVMVHEP